jgi:hypothetical protein
MSARTQNLTQHVLTIEVAKCITTWVHKTPPMLAMKQIVSQLALTKLNDVNEDTEYFSACDDHTQPMPVMTQNVSQNVLTISGKTRNASQHLMTKPLPVFG